MSNPKILRGRGRRINTSMRLVCSVWHVPEQPGLHRKFVGSGERESKGKVSKREQQGGGCLQGRMLKPKIFVL